MLRFEEVTFTYPHQQSAAVEQISFQVAPGELVLCTGASGCGKSTIVRLANGLCPHYFQGKMSGQVFVNGMSTLDYPLHLLADQAGTLFQNPEEQFFALNVEDELVFAHEWRGLPADEIDRKLSGMVKDFKLENLMDSSVQQLSEGQKQKVGLASVMSQKPAALILDEPTANLDPESTLELGRALFELKKQGLAILVVDHRLYWLKDIADRVLIMNQGRICEQGGFGILDDGRICEKYGLRKSQVKDPRPVLANLTNLTAARQGTAKSAAEESQNCGLEVQNLCFAWPGKTPMFHTCDFSIQPGITALIGDNGMGKTTLARLITGLTEPDSGSFTLKGQKTTPDNLLEKSGIVLQNADHQLYMKTVLSEVKICLEIAAMNQRRNITAEEKKKQAFDLLSSLDLERLAPRHPQSLSGGEKQRLVIACALAKQPDMLILDEPTSGLDGRNMRRIANVLRSCAQKETIVLVITHDLELMSDICTQALRLPFEKRDDICGPAVDCPHSEEPTLRNVRQDEFELADSPRQTGVNPNFLME